MGDVESKLRELGERTAERVRPGGLPSGRIVRRARMRRGAALVAAGAAVAVLATVVYPRAADTFRGGGESPIRLAAVAEATEDAGSARMEMEMTMEFSTRKTTMLATGVVDFERRLSELRMERAGADGTVVMELLTIGDSAFERTVTEGEEPSKWYEMEFPGSTGAGALGSTDPSDFLSYLRSVAEEVTDLGTDVVDGVEVRHYRAELEMPTFAEAMPQGLEVDLEPMDVWVDSLGRLRRMAFGMTTDGLTPGSEGSMEMTMRLWDFGVPVDVAAPSPEDVTDEPPEWAGSSSSGEDASMPDGDPPALPGSTAVTGAARFREDYLVLTTGEFALSCVRTRRDDATSATVTNAESGEAVLKIDRQDFENAAAAFGAGMGCAPGVPEDVDELLDHPDRFVLYVEGEGGWHANVPLVFADEIVGAPAQ